MSAAPHHFFDEREAERQAALDRYAIVDTAPEQAFDDIVRLAATLCDVPSAAISLIDHERVWFKAQIGIDQAEVPRAQSLCGQVVDSPRRTLVVHDLLDDPNYAKRRRIGGQPPRFYAGVPLLSPEGHALGVVCVMDVKPRVLTPRQLEALDLLARQTQHLLELRRYGLEQRRLLSEREASARRAEHARDDLQRRHDDLRYTASHDALTGLLNRVALAELHDDPESTQRLHGAPYVMALLDIDHFKQVNDRYGHLLGDRALCAVAHAITTSIRGGDIAVRYGGEEFLVVLPNTRLDGGAEVAERIRLQVLAAELPFELTVSIGIADGMPEQDTPESVFDRADQALYRAKAGGRNRIIADDTPR
ncbi:sensor domain-containing diguanylate cyclase [Lysobacter sp. CFH 32150]|uniref:sensor domain-containing diguanylate cyclase n=1 Tax=Lysobacter sp. CFH 32150 TaxID=2927128 RepID=UPI001FA789D7|nr:sensor domain-containing diguanylate cyclase [Lysobacter sp. CFH 32150]MCI4567578.1 sensor domain-containing diguanylate cyclase [Lysobacter sp. CFH 32150]